MPDRTNLTATPGRSLHFTNASPLGITPLALFGIVDVSPLPSPVMVSILLQLPRLNFFFLLPLIDVRDSMAFSASSPPRFFLVHGSCGLSGSYSELKPCLFLQPLVCQLLFPPFPFQSSDPSRFELAPTIKPTFFFLPAFDFFKMIFLPFCFSFPIFGNPLR